jgi:hypothetical protein
MMEPIQPPASSGPCAGPTPGVYQATRAVVLAALLSAAAVVIVAALAVVAVFFRLSHPAQSNAWPTVCSGIGAIIAIVAGLVIMGWSIERIKRAESFELAAAIYARSCLTSVAMNSAAGVLAILVIFLNGLAGHLWLPDVLVVCVTLLGLILSVPRLKRLRKMHYTPSLPYVRIGSR